MATLKELVERLADGPKQRSERIKANAARITEEWKKEKAATESRKSGTVPPGHHR